MPITDTLPLGNGGLNIFQSAQDKLATQMKVDGVNAKVLEGKTKNAETQKMEFMQILITQLKNQNPLEPLNDKDFIAQMAQLTGVEKLEKINEGMDNLSSIATNNNLFSLIGKRVNYIDHQGQESIGTIDSIDLKEGKGFLSVDGKLVNLSDIHKIQPNLINPQTTPTVQRPQDLKTNTI